MTPVKQTILSDEQKVIHGNCFSACLASLLDLPIEQVPYFYEPRILKIGWGKVLMEFLDKHGYSYEGYLTVTEHDQLTYREQMLDHKGVDGYHIVGGPSPRGSKAGHAVIYKNAHPFFDPHPDETFIPRIEGVYLIERKK